jgi:hypothetical protein
MKTLFEPPSRRSHAANVADAAGDRKSAACVSAMLVSAEADEAQVVSW